MQRTLWLNRNFPVIEDNGLLPSIIERLDGTASRLKQKIENFNNDNLQPLLNKWSIKKEIGHLADLEPLWYDRLIQIISGTDNLSAADMTNKKTNETDHDIKTLEELLNDFKKQRDVFVAKLRSLKDEDLVKSSFHPRLKTQMKIVDLAFFVAEHDDHHLAQITYLAEQN